VRGLPPVTRTLLTACAVGYLLQLLTSEGLVYRYALWPLGERAFGPHFEVWQLLSYAFLHGSFTHLAFNALALYMFGPELERLLGPARFATYYFACVVGAAVTQLAVTPLLGIPPAPTVGASGGIFGLLLAFGLAWPHRRLMLLFPPIPMPAWLFVTLYGSMELVLGVTGTQRGVAHFAHLGGMVAGFLMALYWRTRRR
jgi:membrane associated rhomboid family serine protease